MCILSELETHQVVCLHICTLEISYNVICLRKCLTIGIVEGVMCISIWHIP